MHHSTEIATPSLRFRIGEYAFWIWRPRLVAIDCSGQTFIDWKALESRPLDAALDGYLCRNLTPGDLRAGVRRRGAWLVYVRVEEKSALRRNSTGPPFYAAFLRATNSVLVADNRCAFSSR